MDSRLTIGKWEALFSRWGAPATYVAVTMLAGFILVGVLVRSPNTKSNFQDSRQGYDRTELASIGATDQYMGITERLGTDGKSIYVGAGCALCHGLHGNGAPVGPPVWTISTSNLTKTLRSGGPGMPKYAPERLSDEQIGKIATYLKDMKAQNPNEPEIKKPKT